MRRNFALHAENNRAGRSALIMGLVLLFCILGFAPALADELTLPAALTAIEDEAFMGDTSITSVVIPDGAVSIGVRAFAGCTNLVEVTIPDSVTSIEADAFKGCTGLTVAAPEESYAYEWAIDMGYIAISPTPVEYFSYSIKNGECKIGNYKYDGSKTDVTIPPTIEGCPVTSIGFYAFYESYSLTSITLPNSIRSIAEYAFALCTRLTSINIPKGVTSIGDDAFTYCSSLTSIEIPDSVTSIGNWAFSSCSKLTRIFIPASVTSFGVNVFRYCDNLTIYGIPGSAAEAYAKKNNIAFAVENYNNHESIVGEYYRTIKAYSLEGKRYYRAEQTKDYNGVPYISGAARNCRLIFLDENLHPVTDAEVFAKLYTIQQCDDLLALQIEKNYSDWKYDILTWNETAAGYLETDLLIKNAGRAVGEVITGIMTTGASGWKSLWNWAKGSTQDAAVCAQIKLMNDMTSYAYDVIDYASYNCSILDESGAYCYEKIINVLQQYQMAYECKESIEQLCAPVAKDILEKYGSAWELGTANVLKLFSEMAGNVKPVQFTLNLFVNIIEGDVGSEGALETITDLAAILEQKFTNDTLMSGWLASVTNYISLIECATGINTASLTDITKNYLFTAEEVSQWELYQVHFLLAQ